MLSWFRASRRDDVAMQRYIDIVAAARNPVLFEAFGVPDSLDGRFEAIAMHCWAVLRRLKSVTAAKEINQRLFDILFQDMDQSLREMGVSDIVVGDRVKAMAKGLYGRIAAYDSGLEQGQAAFQSAVERNVYGTAPAPAGAAAALAAYLRAAEAALRGIDDQRMLSVEPLIWPAIPALV